MPFQKLIKAVEEFENESNSILLHLFKDREEEVISLNVDDQLFNKGIDSNGEKLTPPYAASTKKRKRRKGQPTDRVTTRDEGDFHRSIIFDYRQTEVAFGNDDPKFRYLSDRYGEHILGLTPKNIEYLSDDMKDDFVKEARKAILG